LLVVLPALTGCNIVAWKQGQLERSMRAAGLSPGDERLGADTVHYWAGGHGPTVVLVHGFGASAIWQWADQVDALAPDHRVIVPDLLWFGDSRSEDKAAGID